MGEVEAVASLDPCHHGHQRLNASLLLQGIQQAIHDVHAGRREDVVGIRNVAGAVLQMNLRDLLHRIFLGDGLRREDERQEQAKHPHRFN
jgi:hypothetical protein